MSKDEIVAVLCEVARRAADTTTATHPEDIGYTMSFAIETAAMTLDVLDKRKRRSEPAWEGNDGEA